MTHWVYAFAGCPDTGDFQESAGEEEPGEIVFRDRAGGFGVMDGFVRESVDDLMLVAHYRWVASGDAFAVAPAVLRAVSELPPLARAGGK
ncbi:hypothetical protein [Streptomyces sp. NPDC047009]|uniref:hypothetical protein n=1 Tax=Streptomyces sp. NPDC047009 TaxID=3154496 RepID=UPI0033FD867A